jgi:phosphoribosyl 1,2-cyclic phosphodiesterase
MRVKFWGVRGSVPVPNSHMLGYGGNTACVEVTLEDGTEIILDAGTGIRELGGSRTSSAKRLQILLTHLHVDHIHGLLFFPPLFDPDNELTVYGPPAPGPNLDQRLSRYLSPPLSPIDLRELPARVDFRACPYEEWRIGDARVEAALVAHRGVTLGYRITEGSSSLCYIPDHEPALGASLTDADPGWISGSGLAAGVSLLIHDGQYDDAEYPEHVGWGHSSVSDAVAFALRSEPQRLVLSHHDPLHDDRTIDDLRGLAAGRWEEAGRDAAEISMATEGEVIEL